MNTKPNTMVSFAVLAAVVGLMFIGCGDLDDSEDVRVDQRTHFLEEGAGGEFSSEEFDGSPVPLPVEPDDGDEEASSGGDSAGLDGQSMAMVTVGESDDSGDETLTYRVEQDGELFDVIVDPEVLPPDMEPRIDGDTVELQEVLFELSNSQLERGLFVVPAHTDEGN